MSNTNTNGNGYGFWHLIFCSVIVSILLIAFGLLITSHVVDIKFLKDTSCSKVNLLTYCFYDTKWDSGTYLSTITSFYTTLITFLIAIQALVSWLAYAVIKNSHKNHIEESIEGELPRYFSTLNARKLINLELIEAVKQETRILEGRLSNAQEEILELREQLNQDADTDITNDNTDERIEE